MTRALDTDLRAITKGLNRRGNIAYSILADFMSDQFHLSETELMQIRQYILLVCDYSFYGVGVGDGDGVGVGVGGDGNGNGVNDDGFGDGGDGNGNGDGVGNGFS